MRTLLLAALVAVIPLAVAIPAADAKVKFTGITISGKLTASQLYGLASMAFTALTTVHHKRHAAAPSPSPAANATPAPAVGRFGTATMAPAPAK